MPDRNTEKPTNSQGEIQKQYTPILALQNSSHKPYIESFFHEPENIVQQQLGTLFGYFEVLEYSDESAYVVNFLNSVLKKEYFINPKRSVGESLDASLHKVNVALSEIAKHGNVNWLGNLDAAICVLDKNALHFSISGQASLLLSRKGTFNNIGEGLSLETADPHPLKTFVNVASGRLESGDRLIIASRGVFTLFTQQQLKKNNDRLNDEQFVQFLKTALINDAETAHAGVIVISPKILPKKPKKDNPETSTNKIKNAFSQQAFIEKGKSSENQEKAPTEEFADKDSEYTDVKTGHIYVQGEQLPNETESRFSESLSILREKVSDSLQHTKNRLRRKIMLIRKSLRKPTLPEQSIEEALPEEPPKEKLPVPTPSVPPETETLVKITKKTTRVKTPDIVEVKPAKKVTTDISTKGIIKSETKKETETVSIKETTLPESKPKKETFFEIYQKERASSPKETAEMTTSFAKKITSLFKNIFQLATNATRKSINSAISFLNKIKNKKTALSKQSESENTSLEKPRIKNLLIPSLLRIKKAFFLLSPKQRAWSFLIIVAIIVLPLLIVSLTKSKPLPKQQETVQAPIPEQLLAGEKNISFTPNISEAASLQNTLAILPTDNGTIFISKNNLAISGEQQTQLPIPIQSGEVTYATFMKDLSLVFLLTSNNKVLSFSQTTKQFKENNIEFPVGFKPKGIATYLTYLYVVDANSNQIYRYPRAEGGFGAKTDWLKDTINISSVNNITIDDSIYLAYSDKLVKLFKGKQDNLSFEQSATPIVFSAAYTDTEQSSIYILDKQNSRIIVFDKSNGQIRKQYYDASFAAASSVAASEKDKKIYIATPSTVHSIAIE